MGQDCYSNELSLGSNWNKKIATTFVKQYTDLKEEERERRRIHRFERGRKRMQT